MLLAALAVGGVGTLSWFTLFPATSAAPAAYHLGSGNPQVTSHASNGGPASGSYYSSPPRTYAPPSRGTHGSAPTPTATGSAGTPTATSQAGPMPTPVSTAPTASPAASPSTSFSVFPTDSGTSSTVPAAFPTDPGTSTLSPVVFPTDSGTSSTLPSASASASGSASSSTPYTNALGLGFYDGTSSPAGIETAASWLGSASSVKYAEDFIDATDWSHISTPWQLSNWKGSPYEMVWGVPIVPCGAPSTQCATNQADYNLVATGGANGYYQTLAQNLVAAGFGTSYIRLGWEFNADWMGWGVCNSSGSGLASWAGDFVPAFQQIVTTMRSVAGANFKFIWNPIDSSNASCTGANLENFYPGDGYVDAVALDTYDGLGTATSTDSARFTDLQIGVNATGWTAVAPAAINGQTFQGYGLDWLAAFGKAHTKEVSLPEWGLESSSSNGGGGDDAYFITQMANWIKANGSGPMILWNYGGGTLTLNIPGYTTGTTPNASAAFQAAFSTGI